MGSLSDLPNELISYLLAFLAFNDIISCQATCHFLHQLITTSSTIQYQVALEIAGLENNPQGSTLSIQDRLQLLRRREAAWAFFQPNFTEEIPIDHTLVVVYELSGGFYMLSGVGRVCFLRLPSEPNESLGWRRIKLDDELLDFGLAATEHDMTGVLTTTSEDDSTTLQLRFLQLSTGLPHPLSGSPMQFPQLNILPDNLGVSIEIVADLAALIIRDVSFGQYDDKLFILDWKRSMVRAEMYTTNPRRYQSVVFLTPDILLVTNAHERCLEIWRIPSDSGTATLPIICRKPELSLGLPAINAGFMFTEFACRGAPNPILSNRHSTRPFHSSPSEAIMVFHVTISPVNPRVPIPFLFFAHRKTFLDLLQKSLKLKEPQAGLVPVPWSDWGPPVTRWLHARSIPTEWITTTSGQRYAFVSTHAPSIAQPVVVLDFNQNNVRKVIADEKNKKPPYHRFHGNVSPAQNHEAPVMATGEMKSVLWNRIWLQSLPDTYEKMKVFREEVGGHLPYVAVKSSESYPFHGVLLDDERIIGVKRNHGLSGVESIEILHLG